MERGFVFMGIGSSGPLRSQNPCRGGTRVSGHECADAKSPFATPCEGWIPCGFAMIRERAWMPSGACSLAPPGFPADLASAAGPPCCWIRRADSFQPDCQLHTQSTPSRKAHLCVMEVARSHSRGMTRSLRRRAPDDPDRDVCMAANLSFRSGRKGRGGGRGGVTAWAAPSLPRRSRCRGARS
jgi:hypothetical protein